MAIESLGCGGASGEVGIHDDQVTAMEGCHGTELLPIRPPATTGRAIGLVLEEHTRLVVRYAVKRQELASGRPARSSIEGCPIHVTLCPADRNASARRAWRHRPACVVRNKKRVPARHCCAVQHTARTTGLVRRDRVRSLPRHLCVGDRQASPGDLGRPEVGHCVMGHPTSPNRAQRGGPIFRPKSMLPTCTYCRRDAIPSSVDGELVGVFPTGRRAYRRSGDLRCPRSCCLQSLAAIDEVNLSNDGAPDRQVEAGGVRHVWYLVRHTSAKNERFPGG